MPEIQGRRLLTLPDGYESAAAPGLDVYTSRSYDEVVDMLAQARRPRFADGAR